MRTLLATILLLCAGCSYVPQVARRPVVRNPFPQLMRVAVAPFINLSAEPSVNGRQFALAYFNELQLVQGFDVVPIGVVEMKMREHGLSLASAHDARKLAHLLEVDAIVVGTVTDFSPYYPPRCGLRVEWYAANPYVHPIPPGYGLPWGQPAEEEVPEPLVFETALTAARNELAAPAEVATPAPLEPMPLTPPELLPVPSEPAGESETLSTLTAARGSAARISKQHASAPLTLEPIVPVLPADQPAMRHTRTYNGHDFQLTQLLKEYAYFRDDQRSGGWESYLQRSDDFVRFCCHLHISEMLSARGGAAESQVVWRWPKCR